RGSPRDVGRLAQGQSHLPPVRRRLGVAQAPADGADARRSDRALRDRRTQEVPDRGRTPLQGGQVSYEAKFRVWRGDEGQGALTEYTVEVNEGEVVLDIIHRLQATQAPDLAVRWNCKAGKCGSCSAEINGMPRLMCMTRMSVFAPEETVTVTPVRTFPVIRDLVTDV